MFTIEVTHNVSTTVVSLLGDLNADFGDDLSREVLYLLEDGYHQLMINLSQVSDLGTHGVLTLRGLVEKASKYFGATIKLVVPTYSTLWGTLREYRVEEWADVYPEVRMALESIFS